MEQSTLSTIQHSRLKGCCLLIKFNAAFTLFPLDFDKALFNSTSLLFVYNFGSLLVAMRFEGFGTSNSHKLEILENFHSKGKLPKMEDAKVEVPTLVPC